MRRVSLQTMVSDIDGRESKVPVPLVIITFQCKQRSMAAVNTPKGCKDNVRLSHRADRPLRKKTKPHHSTVMAEVC